MIQVMFISSLLVVTAMTLGVLVFGEELRPAHRAICYLIIAAATMAAVTLTVTSDIPPGSEIISLPMMWAAF